MMRLSRILGALAVALRLESVLLLVPIPVALHFSAWDTVVAGIVMPRAALALLASSVLCAVVWAPLILLTRDARQEDMLEREAMLTVALGWIVASLFGMLPFLLVGAFTGPGAIVSAFFETMSGFTGTGMTALVPAALDTTDKAILMWRALTQFAGALGVIVLFIALFSRLQAASLPLVQQDAGGHLTRRLQPKLAETARTLWVLYLGIAATLALLLTFVLRRQLPWDQAVFESLCHVFSALSTGGFATQGANLGLYDDWLFEAGLIVCMLLGATNFTLIVYLLRRRDTRILRDPEWRFWVAMVGITILLNAGLLWRAGTGAVEALRGSTFTVTAFASGTAGLHAADYSRWPAASLVLLTIMMFLGGMAGSAAGGVKGTRWLILFKMLGREIRRVLHPRAVIPVRVGGRVLKEETLSAVAAFFFTYLAAWVLGTILLTALDGHFDLESGAFASAAALGNAGGGIGLLGPSFGYAAALPVSKMILAALMWGGRLELIAALLVFYPKAWKS